MEATLLENRIFALDPQVLFDTGITLIAVFFLFILMSFLLFEPVRNLLKKRQEYIEEQLANAASTQEEADSLKEEYEKAIAVADDEAQEILVKARKKAKEKETEIISEANEEATRIKNRALKDVELEKAKLKDEMKKEMVEVATAMAGRFVEESLDDKTQTKLIDETLEKMGDSTWQN